MKSKKWTLNIIDYKTQLKSAFIWLIPVGLFYLGQLSQTLNESGFLTWIDFIPDRITIGASQLYVVNQLFGLFLKFKKGK